MASAQEGKSSSKYSKISLRQARDALTALGWQPSEGGNHTVWSHPKFPGHKATLSRGRGNMSKNDLRDTAKNIGLTYRDLEQFASSRTLQKSQKHRQALIYKAAVKFGLVDPKKDRQPQDEDRPLSKRDRKRERKKLVRERMGL